MTKGELLALAFEQDAFYKLRLRAADGPPTIEQEITMTEKDRATALPLFSEATMEHLFTYHQPTERTAPLHTAVNEDYEDSLPELERALDPNNGMTAHERFGHVGECMRLTAGVFLSSCPDGLHKALALLTLGLSRNAMNKGVTVLSEGGRSHQQYLAIAKTELEKAVWLANTAIACGPVVMGSPLEEHPDGPCVESSTVPAYMSDVWESLRTAIHNARLAKLRWVTWAPKGIPVRHLSEAWGYALSRLEMEESRVTWRRQGTAELLVVLDD